MHEHVYRDGSRIKGCCWCGYICSLKSHLHCHNCMSNYMDHLWMQCDTSGQELERKSMLHILCFFSSFTCICLGVRVDERLTVHSYMRDQSNSV